MMLITVLLLMKKISSFKKLKSLVMFFFIGMGIQLYAQQGSTACATGHKKFAENYSATSTSIYGTSL